MWLFFFYLNMMVKQEVFKECVRIIHSKIEFNKGLLKELAQGAENATKSSAGDKHETGRAMVQLEQEKIGNQLLELETMHSELLKLNNPSSSNKITKGSLIYTNSGYFYLSVAIGKITVENKSIYVLSPKSPLGQLLLGLEKGQKATFNAKVYEIYSVL